MVKLRRKRLSAAIIGASLLTAIALMVPSGTASATGGHPHSTKASLPSAAAQMFADHVQTLGETSYANSFAGVSITPSGATEVYAIAGSDAHLVSAIKAIDTAGYPVQFIGVSRSYNQLNELANQLMAENAHFLKIGIKLVQSEPDPASSSL